MWRTSVVGCQRVGGVTKKGKKKMSEKVINSKSGRYGRVQVTLLMPVKEEILDWSKQLGINKAAFLRMALMIGASQLVKDSIFDYSSEEKRDSRKTRKCLMVENDSRTGDEHERLSTKEA